MRELAVYIHIPFCDHKCIYCDFYSVTTLRNKTRFFEALKKEIDFYARKLANSYSVSTIFFGGGTPSLMEPHLIGEIIEYLNKKFNFNSPLEITLETNPGTVNPNKLKAFKKAGINRLSVGVQSFDDDDLKFLTRIHDSRTAVRTVKKAADAGFENLSVDLIFNLPNQTIKKWQKNLEIATALPVKHISAYSLIVESGTALKALINKGKVQIASTDYDAKLYLQTIEYLTNKGFAQYEVSNFAKKGFECRHNLFYWRYKDYLGLGPSAHSFIEGKRWLNYSNLTKYVEELSSNFNAIKSSETLTEKEMLEEFVMLSLRSEGLDLNLLSGKFGEDWKANNKGLLKKLEENNFARVEKNKIKLTPKGYALCDEILLNFKF